jgi:hypothetical protein
MRGSSYRRVSGSWKRQSFSLQYRVFASTVTAVAVEAGCQDRFAALLGLFERHLDFVLLWFTFVRTCRRLLRRDWIRRRLTGLWGYRQSKEAIQH